MQPRKNAKPALLILSLTLVLLGLLAAFAFKLSGDVNRRFGPPDSKLSLHNLLRQTLTLYTSQERLLEPAIYPAEVKFRIAEAETVGQLCQRLEAEGLVQSGELTCGFMVYSGLDRRLQTGQFSLEPGLNAVEIARRFADPAARDLQVAVFAGWRLEEVLENASILGAAFPTEKLWQLLFSPPPELARTLGLPPGASAEGFIQPGTYYFKPYSQPEAIFAEFVSARIRQGEKADAELAGRNWRDLLTVASIVEREAMVEAEMPMIASVIFNRLALGMRLEMDSTVQYAIGQPGLWWKAPLSLDDTRQPSPYNTYQIPGLQPGPICNPSDAALEAALHPETSLYLFFVARCDGSGLHNFSQTFEEHLEKLCP